MTRPMRQRRDDRILFGSGSSKEQIACDMATGPFDEAVRAMNLKWGIDRLPELVSAPTAAKWGSALAKLNDAIESGNVEDTVARVEVCIRGLAAMDAEAIARSHLPTDPEIWEAEVDGFRVGLIRDIAYWQAAQAKRPDLQIVSLREAAIAVAAYRTALPLVDAVKVAMPGAEISKITNRNIEDEIPW